MQPLLVRLLSLLFLILLLTPMLWATFKAVFNSGLQGGLTRALREHDGFVLEVETHELVRFRAPASDVRPAVVARQRSSTNSKGYTSREWAVEVAGLDELAARTDIFVGLEGLKGMSRNRRSIVDVKIGDRRFDRTFKVGGSDTDVVRGVFAHDDVKAAVRALFKGVTVFNCAVERGSLVVEFLPDHVRTTTGRKRIDLVVRLAAALQSASASLALKEAARISGSVSSSSGSSVGVRIL